MDSTFGKHIHTLTPNVLGKIYSKSYYYHNLKPGSMLVLNENNYTMAVDRYDIDSPYQLLNWFFE